ncbi:MAG: hypothetical protein ACE5H3_05070 [Planctomycetota bacterium]
MKTTLLAGAFLSAFLVSSPPAPSQGKPVLKTGDRKKLAKPVGDWIQAKISKDYEKALDAFSSADKASASVQKKLRDKPLFSLVSDWEAILDSARKFTTSGLRKGKVENASVGEETYGLRLPKSYRPTKASYPAILLLPDSGSAPMDAIQTLPADTLDQWVVIAPDLQDVPADQVLELKGRTRILRSFGSAGLRIHLDRNRVFLLGQGSNASTAVTYAALLPHFFAAAAVVGDEQPTEEQKNDLQWVPFQAFSDAGEACKWFLDQKPRTAYPSSFQHTLTQPWAGRAYWVQALRFEPSAADGKGKPARMKVAVDRGSNTIRLDCTNVYEVALYLNDEILDLSKPIHVVRNGTDFEYQATRSLSTLLNNYVRTGDALAIFPAMIRRLSIPSEVEAGS